MLGSIIEAGKYVLRKYIGKAENDKVSFDLNCSFSDGSPMVHDLKSDRYWCLPWSDICYLAEMMFKHDGTNIDLGYWSVEDSGWYAADTHALLPVPTHFAYLNHP